MAARAAAAHEHVLARQSTVDFIGSLLKGTDTPDEPLPLLFDGVPQSESAFASLARAAAGGRDPPTPSPSLNPLAHGGLVAGGGSQAKASVETGEAASGATRVGAGVATGANPAANPGAHHANANSHPQPHPPRRHHSRDATTVRADGQHIAGSKRPAVNGAGASDHGKRPRRIPSASEVDAARLGDANPPRVDSLGSLRAAAPPTNANADDDDDDASAKTKTEPAAARIDVTFPPPSTPKNTAAATASTAATTTTTTTSAGETAGQDEKPETRRPPAHDRAVHDGDSARGREQRVHRARRVGVPQSLRPVSRRDVRRDLRRGGLLVRKREGRAFFPRPVPRRHGRARARGPRRGERDVLQAREEASRGVAAGRRGALQVWRHRHAARADLRGAALGVARRGTREARRSSFPRTSSSTPGTFPRRRRRRRRQTRPPPRVKRRINRAADAGATPRGGGGGVDEKYRTHGAAGPARAAAAPGRPVRDPPDRAAA